MSERLHVAGSQPGYCHHTERHRWHRTPIPVFLREMRNAVATKSISVHADPASECLQILQIAPFKIHLLFAATTGHRHRGGHFFLSTDLLWQPEAIKVRCCSRKGDPAPVSHIRYNTVHLLISSSRQREPYATQSRDVHFLLYSHSISMIHYRPTSTGR